MLVVKALVVSLIAIVVLFVVTFVYCYHQLTKRGVATASGAYLFGLLLNSPVYWLLVVAILAAMWWLFRGWFKVSG